MWCKKCQEFELFVSDLSEKEWKCKECGSPKESVLLKDIPEEKIEEQRKRYRASQDEAFHKFTAELFATPEQRKAKELAHMFSAPGSDVEIIESPAGQDVIDKALREKLAKEREERRAQAEADKAEVTKYRKVNRNDLCICGSGKKYKKCCEPRIIQIGG